MTENEDPVVAQIQLGLLLGRLRDGAEIGTEAAGKAIGTSKASISRIENGKQSIVKENVQKLLELYEANAEDQDEALRLAAVPKPSRSRRRRDAGYRDDVPNWFRRYRTLEAAASEISTYEAEIVTGLFQTEDYARVLLQAGNPIAGRRDIDRQVELRRGRQQILERAEPPQLDVILNEAVLHRVIGDDSVMAAQLDHLVELAEQPFIELRVLPFRPKPTPNRDEAFVAKNVFKLLRLPDRGTILYFEEVGGATYPEDTAVIERYAVSYQRLRAAAADPGDSREIIARIANDYR
ncbi:helix-turn-helix protein [Herbihabitans rhizosphaerae]|uniref:Helix-turn-helix protein n=1 Tax=Herbihabitans rhizosphaerae TaxID=1872711 RepID=A0A4Q7L6W3_9PSEU|nr:helix-turn-helix transcriptional regulator [Herbihabitans rhizosphaerae]RZS44351.1 helix-turn-helix protein [Herbihabitans rhizosphaerae]